MQKRRDENERNPSEGCAIDHKGAGQELPY